MVDALDGELASVRYMTYLQDDEFVNYRLASISAFLEVSGVDVTGLEIAVGMPGSRTMRADEAIAAGFADAKAPETDLVAHAVKRAADLAGKDRGIFGTLKHALWADIAADLDPNRRR